MGTGDSELIAKVIGSYARENELLNKQLLDFMYYMRGALSRDDAWQLSPYEREQLTEYLNTRFENAGEMMKKGISVFI